MANGLTLSQYAVGVLIALSYVVSVVGASLLDGESLVPDYVTKYGAWSALDVLQM